MMPRLSAEESLLACTRVAIGSGTADKAKARKVTRAWQGLVDGAATPKAIKASPDDLRAMGITVRKVKRGG